MKRWLILSLCLLPTLALALNLYEQPGLQFARSGASPLDLTNLRGKPAVINFWATWCPACRDEVPDLAQLHQKTGATFVGIAVEDNLAFATEYARVQGVAYPIAGGKDPAIVLMRQLGNPTAATPFTVLINAAGEVIWTHKGRIPMGELEQRLRELR